MKNIIKFTFSVGCLQVEMSKTNRIGDTEYII